MFCGGMPGVGIMQSRATYVFGVIREMDNHDMSGRLEGKVCIITRTGGSIGREAALRFAKEGARIVDCDINEAAAHEIELEVCAAGGRMVSFHPCDLTHRMF
jgi:FlaA1/EpsC-like NDP-sugar epimerase